MLGGEEVKEFSIEQVGKRVRSIRQQLNLTREEFAEQVGISPQFLAEIENGKKGMSAETLYKICSRFDMSSDYILLGKTSSSQMADPIQKMLEGFSPSYLEMTEDIIRAIRKVATAE